MSNINKTKEEEKSNLLFR